MIAGTPQPRLTIDREHILDEADIKSLPSMHALFRQQEFIF